MDTKTVAVKCAEKWGVVYSYGSVLAIFENEQEALLEASRFGGAVVRIVQNVLGMADGGASDVPVPGMVAQAIA